MCTVESINVFLVITLFAFGWVESLALNLSAAVGRAVRQIPSVRYFTEEKWNQREAHHTYLSIRDI